MRIWRTSNFADTWYFLIKPPGIERPGCHKNITICIFMIFCTFDHFWRLFQTYQVGLSRFTVAFYRWIVDFHRWMRALEKVLDVPWGRFWVGITWGMVLKRCVVKGSHIRYFSTIRGRCFEWGKNENQWEVEKKLKSEIMIFFHGPKVIFSGESENRKIKSDFPYAGTPYNLSLDSTVWRIFKTHDFLMTQDDFLWGIDHPKGLIP